MKPDFEKLVSGYFAVPASCGELRKLLAEIYDVGFKDGTERGEIALNIAKVGTRAGIEVAEKWLTGDEPEGSK